MKRAVFAGSFDPFTLGHKDIVLRAAKLFDEVVVAVASDTGKTSRPIDKRAEIVTASFIDKQNICVMQFEGLLTDFMKKVGSSILVRGVRNSADYDYERSLMAVYRSLYPEIEFVLLPSKAELIHVSSTTVRQLCKMNASLNGYIDTKVEKYVRNLYRE